MADKRKARVISETIRFSTNGAAFSLLQGALVKKNVPVKEEPISHGELLNTPIYENIEIKGGNYQPIDSEDNIPYAGGVGSSFVLNSVIMSISMTKNIVVTVLQGRNGTFKEYISDGDYLINLTGSLVDKYPIYPEDKLIMLIGIVTAPKELEIANKTFTLLGIKNVVVTDFEFKQKQGFRNMIDFNINLLSDDFIETD